MSVVGFTSIIGVIALVYGVIFLVAVLSYVFRALGLYGIAKRQNESAPGLAWVPVANLYLHGAVAGPLQLGRKRIQNPGVWMLCIPIGGFVLVALLYGVIIFGMLFNFSRGPASQTFPIGLILLLLLFYLLLLAWSVFSCVSRVIVNYAIFSRYNTPLLAVLHAACSLFIPLYEAIYLYKLRNRTPHTPCNG